MKTTTFKQGFKTLLVLLTGLLAMSGWGQAVYTGNFSSSTGAGASYAANKVITLEDQIWLASYSYHNGGDFRIGRNNTANVPAKFITPGTPGASIEMQWDIANVKTISLETLTVYGTVSNWYIFESIDGGTTWTQVATGTHTANLTWSYTATSPKPSARYAFVMKGSGDPRVRITTVTITSEEEILPTVTFNSNGGSGTMTAQSANAATALTANAFTRADYEYGRWNTAADGSGTYYDDEASYPFDADVTLYAQWNPIITYDANGGSNPPTSIATDNDGIHEIKPRGVMSFTSHAFIGWNAQVDGLGTDYTVGQDYTFTTPTTLYAQWELCAGTIAFIKPSSGAPVGTEITIAIVGNYFISGQSYTVNFNGSAAVQGTAISTTQLKVTVPAGASGGFYLETEQPCDSISTYTIITKDITGCN